MIIRDKLKPVTRRMAFLLEWIISAFDFKGSTSKQREHSKIILVLKTDAIGDYILFRNFLKYYRTCNRYSGYRILFVGNISFKSLSISLDTEYYDYSIWLDVKKLTKSIHYRRSVIKEINSYNPEIIINTVFSRAFHIDHIVKSCCAHFKIAINGDKRNTLFFLRRISDRYYNQLINLPENCYFEFYKNKMITELITDQNTDISQPFIEFPNDFSYELPVKEEYAVLFPGAAASNRKWPLENYFELAEYLIEKYHLTVVFTGQGANINKTHDKIVDLINKTDLLQLASLIKNAALIIGNDTSAIHLGVATGANTICISNGNHYARFVPYPKEVYSKIITIFPPRVNKNAKKGELFLIKKYASGSLINIKSIKTDVVKDKIDLLLNAEFSDA